MKKLLPLLFMMVILSSCKKNDEFIANKQDQFDAVYQKYHGRYEIISSIADQPVDLNFDGDSSTNMLVEYVDLKRINNTILVNKKSTDGKFDVFYSHFWPDQYLVDRDGEIKVKNLNEYKPSIFIMYANHAVGNLIKIEKNNSITFLEEADENANSQEFTRPQNLYFDKEGILNATLEKTVYTRYGVKTIKINTKYKRTSMQT